MTRVFIPIKGESVRVPGKNFRDFDGLPLWKRCLRKFCHHFYVHVDTDSQKLIDEIKKDFCPDVITAVLRKKHLRGNDITMNALLQDFATCYCQAGDTVAQVHVTSPFLRAETVHNAMRPVELGEADSVVSCNHIQSRLWRRDSYGYVPVNHNPMLLQNTQNLPVFYEENSAFYIFRASLIQQSGNRVGTHPMFIEVPFPENLDIDTEADWSVCIKLAEVLKGGGK